MPRRMIAGLLALALGFAALPLFSVLAFGGGSQAEARQTARVIDRSLQPSWSGAPVEPAAMSPSGHGHGHCPFAEGEKPNT